MKKGLLVLSTLLLLASCGKTEEVVIEKTKKPVVVTEVKNEVVSDTYLTDGNILPQEKVNYTLNTQGTVVSVLKQNGDFVKKGEVVAKFKDAAAEASYQSAKANLDASKFNLESTKTNYDKFSSLYNKQMISQLEFFSYRDAYTNAVGDFAAKQAMFEDAKSNYDKLTRKSEINGLVGNLDLKPGNVVNANTTLFTVVDEDVMEVTVDFPGYWLNNINVGSPATLVVSDLGGKEYSANIKSINPIADPETKKFPIKISIENKDKSLKDGMYSRVIVPTEKRDGIVVPQESVFIRDLLS